MNVYKRGSNAEVYTRISFAYEHGHLFITAHNEQREVLYQVTLAPSELAQVIDAAREKEPA